MLVALGKEFPQGLVKWTPRWYAALYKQTYRNLFWCYVTHVGGKTNLNLTVLLRTVSVTTNCNFFKCRRRRRNAAGKNPKVMLLTLNSNVTFWKTIRIAQPTTLTYPDNTTPGEGPQRRYVLSLTLHNQYHLVLSYLKGQSRKWLTNS